MLVENLCDLKFEGTNAKVNINGNYLLHPFELVKYLDSKATRVKMII